MRIKAKISRALAIVTVLFLICGIGINITSAKLFTDDDQIGNSYMEAIVSMSENEVLTGFPDGSFHPLEILTREQAAKIVVFMQIGSEKAEALICDVTLFVDVDSMRWSAPYIAWCVEKGILHGYGDGYFGPEDSLTGTQFAKMLICAFNGGSKESYTSTKWVEAVQEDGQKLGLFAGDSEMRFNRPLQRQQAALMAYNATQLSERLPESSSNNTSNEPTLVPTDPVTQPDASSGSTDPASQQDANSGSIDPVPPQQEANSGSIDPVPPQQDTNSGSIDSVPPQQDTNSGSIDPVPPQQDANSGSIDPVPPQQDANSGSIDPNEGELDLS